MTVYWAQAGIIENIDFFERQSGRVDDSRALKKYNLDNYIQYDKCSLHESGSSPYLLYSFARDDRYPDDGEVPRATSMGWRFWSPFASEWLLQVPAEKVSFEIEAIEDILIQMTLTAGQPSCPRRWSENCG